MASFYSYVFLLICATTLFLFMKVDAGIEGTHHFEWVNTKPQCKGSIAECMEYEEQEFDLDSEINRRILATTSYISYGALQRNTVPCSRRGASYYNCRTGAQANPYRRGCSAITRCRS
ncbi:hypothetical protein TanjilG_22604 [Lupinus angustifolius]|uniref:Rapid ALkalinization Factor n=1 Tax=Lupinus angustifolius TaxID=3871 RepID=A0A4P1RT62_LUPAN|nr:PREDICTED: protein RALF-like 33 [Lupinus angustifolius]OIW17492.1 hypothetical protein TanjilG_22604 [Lupinus angustifolius]